MLGWEIEKSEEGGGAEKYWLIKNAGIKGTITSKREDNQLPILRTNAGEITLKLSNDNDTAFCGMTSMASAAVEFGNGATPATVPNVHVKYDDDDMEIDEITFHWH